MVSLVTLNADANSSIHATALNN